MFAHAIVHSPAFRQAVGVDGWENEVSREIIAEWARQPTSKEAGEALHNAAADALQPVKIHKDDT
jgi:hypothetical protein